MRPIPQSARALIMSCEQCRLHAYRPTPRDVPTIGYGHTRGVTMGQTITQAEALAFLDQDLGWAAERLVAVIGPGRATSLNDNQYGALLSFVFNCGADASWTIWRRVQTAQLDKVPIELARFVRCGGQVLNGLIARRRREADLWNTPAAADFEPIIVPHVEPMPQVPITPQPDFAPLPETHSRPDAPQPSLLAALRDFVLSILRAFASLQRSRQ